MEREGKPCADPGTNDHTLQTARDKRVTLRAFSRHQYHSFELADLALADSVGYNPDC